jgi:threonine/homoserine/homoserine lactone efflux protein
MSPLHTLIPVLLALAVAAVSPGPSFVFVARTAIAGSRTQGLASAAGMGVGGMIFAIAVMIGLQALLNKVAWLYLTLKVGGCAYLIFLGITLWRNAANPIRDDRTGGIARGSVTSSFVVGLVTQLSNPKTAVVYGSIFSALLPREMARPVELLLPVLVFFIEAGWYAVVAVALSSASPRKAYVRCKTGIDRMAGVVLSLLGLSLLCTHGDAR